MNLEAHWKRCRELYPEETARKLFEAMRELHEKDFCVSFGWDCNEVSISRSCMKRGRIFPFANDYTCLIFPNGKAYRIKELSHEDIAYSLPTARLKTGETNCYFGLQETEQFKSEQRREGR